jgi:hypothetical protein
VHALAQRACAPLLEGLAGEADLRHRLESSSAGCPDRGLTAMPDIHVRS